MLAAAMAVPAGRQNVSSVKVAGYDGLVIFWRASIFASCPLPRRAPERGLR